MIDRDARREQIRERPTEHVLDLNTPVISLGSCFADHIRVRLKERGYNYLIAEPNAAGTPANWGRIYNPISLRQVIDYCVVPRWRPQERWWRDGAGRIHDPYRAIAAYPDEAAAESDFGLHQTLARRVFESAAVVVLTYGVCEVWESAIDGAVFQGRPVAFDPARHRFRLLEYSECLEAIESACAGVRLLNPDATLILTVSPVPLRATFRPEVSPVTANAYSKAVLVAAVQTACRRVPAAHYFPSYELVNDCVLQPYRADGNVESATVQLVMDLFERCFVRA